MLAQEMLVADVLGQRAGGGVERARHQRHFGQLLQHHGVVDGVRAVLAPGEVKKSEI